MHKRGNACRRTTTGFPDASSTLDDLVFAGDQGVWRASGRATQRGAWQGIAASGREGRWMVIIGRFGFVALVSTAAASGYLGFGVTVVVTVASAEPFPLVWST
jgi:hypothetical protein